MAVMLFIEHWSCECALC